MQTIEILDIKPFMQQLFQSDLFDKYEFVSGELTTDMSYSFDGRWNRNFFTEEESASLELSSYTYLPWTMAKEKLFMLIRGKKTPSHMKLVLKLNQLEPLLSGVSTHADQIDGAFLNIIFKPQTLTVICGVSYPVFTMDKTLEHEFSQNIMTLFKTKHIACQ